MNVSLAGIYPNLTLSGHPSEYYSLQRNLFLPEDTTLNNASTVRLYMTPDLCSTNNYNDLTDCFGQCNDTTMFHSLASIYDCSVGMLLSHFLAFPGTGGAVLFSAPMSTGAKAKHAEVSPHTPVQLPSREIAQITGDLIMECLLAGRRALGETDNDTHSGLDLSTDDPVSNLAKFGSSFLQEDLCPLVHGFANPDLGGIGVTFIPCLYNITG